MDDNRQNEKIIAPASPKRSLIIIPIGIAVFIAANLLARIPLGIHRVLTIQLSLLLFSLVLIAAFSKGKFAEYGFRWPKELVAKHWLLAGFAALVLGIISTLTIAFSGAGGLPLTKQLSIPQIIFYTWVVASICEEVFTRGLIQGHLAPYNDKNIRVPLGTINLPVLISALMFGSMHIVVAFSGADMATTIIIIFFTFFLGLLAGHVRARSQSLLPAIVIHFLGNFGGIIGGIIYAVLTFLITGHPPKMP